MLRIARSAARRVKGLQRSATVSRLQSDRRRRVRPWVHAASMAMSSRVSVSISSPLRQALFAAGEAKVTNPVRRVKNFFHIAERKFFYLLFQWVVIDRLFAIREASHFDALRYGALTQCVTCLTQCVSSAALCASALAQWYGVVV